MTESSGKRAKSGWLIGVFLIALTYPLLDVIGGWLRDGYVGFFIQLTEVVNFAIPWKSLKIGASLSDLGDRASSAEGGVFLIVCWIILNHWPERPRHRRMALIRSWIRRPFRRGLSATIIVIFAIAIPAVLFDVIGRTSLLLIHPFIARWWFDDLIAEVAALAAFEEYRGRKFVRKRRAEAATRTLLDRLVS